MSKKMWHKIFKSKSQKQQKQQQQLSKINKRHSRGIYEEYQQLNELLNGEKLQTICSENQMQNEMPNENENENKYGNVFEQQPPQSSFNSTALTEAQQLQQQQQHAPQLSTFTRVRNTFSLRRSSNNSNNNNKNVKPTNMESDTGDDEQLPGPPPGPLTTGHSVPVDEHVSSTGTDLTPCPNCSRTFNLSALRKHVVVCEKMTKKRKVFDSSRQRRDGTALSTYVLPKNFGLPNAEKASGVHTPPAASREASTVSTSGMSQSMQEVKESPQMLRRTTARTSMRKPAAPAATEASPAATAATVTATAAPAAAGAPPLARDRMRSSDRSLARRIQGVASERCPHCERSFNPKAFDRHVEWCKEKAIQATIKSSSTTETSKAKERMEARKQYRPPNLKTKRSINRDKYSNEEQYEQEMVSPKQYTMSTSSMASSVHSDNGFSSLAGDKYDPFLSAKRQLEELCTPNTPPDNELPTPTATTIMSSSLTGSLTKPMTMTTPNATSTPKATAPSNFRRTASLRGPRRTPLLPSRPLFATNYRPTIQRGLSDEGPISSNFLKPEEYDEMPVRAACGNDFHSPRVVRRDTSASNRKQQLKLPLSAANESQPQRNVAKTDSLAVFLKYEHELEQLNAKAAEVAAKNKELSSKELKDKSNNLSKQNSAKNLNTQLPPLIKPSATPSKENNENLAPLRLEPLLHKPSTPNVNQQPIKLEHIFGGQRLAEFIDPKLINACDNLNVCATSSEASSTPQTLLQSRSSSQSTITQERRHSGEARNLLKRKMRLGRNQFLYDASPEEAGSCADDEGNRSSLEFDEQCWQQQQKQQQQLTHTLPTPSFDDFDFEEFLSSFAQEHDQEQFPLFRDCREFLLNRTTSRQRSCQKASSTLTPTLTTTTPTATPRQPQFITPPSANSLLPSAHRSTGSNDSGSVSSEKSASNSRYATASSSSGGGGGGSADEKSLKQDESQKREIFISIETEPNAQGSSPISPDSLRHMVGNAQTPIDVLHIENGNEPEHAKFSKISDNEEQQEAEFAAEASRIPKRRPATAAGSSATLPALSLAPNVEANNAKNAFERMRNDFQQLGEQIGASVRRDLLQRQEQVLQQQQQQQIQAQQQELKANSPLTPSPSGDSDEQSSLDGYPMSSSHSSHHGVSFKNSTDSAYGSNSPASLSRQRSSEIQLQSNNNNNKLLRPHTASGALSTSSKQSLGVDAITQAQCDYGKPLKARQRMFAGGGVAGDGIAEYSSSGSEQSLPAAVTQQQTSNYNYQQQQQLQHQHEQQQLQQYQQPYNNNNGYELNANNLSNSMLGGTVTPTMSQHSLMSNTSNGSSSMTTSMKMSKFCHECGCKFVLEQAKFCTECGVKRAML
ncbi:PHD finger protein rhinoceros isoform X2 [Drosophila busckii]|uniref:PHD finger protein rhinoceros isoform X2 n=1 Tax=Drosophila busckii TaxID=30019 RepID=UPI00083F07E5|nr:PHD finger protein rhinoceros isoform X2 [Drosophila busckii]